jgi:hypothetical protein
VAGNAVTMKTNTVAEYILKKIAAKQFFGFYQTREIGNFDCCVKIM